MNVDVPEIDVSSERATLTYRELHSFASITHDHSYRFDVRVDFEVDFDMGRVCVIHWHGNLLILLYNEDVSKRFTILITSHDIPALSNARSTARLIRRPNIWTSQAKAAWVAGIEDASRVVRSVSSVRGLGRELDTIAVPELISNVVPRKKEVEVQVHIWAFGAVRRCWRRNEGAHGVVDLRDSSTAWKVYAELVHAISIDLNFSHPVIASGRSVDILRFSCIQV